MCYLGNLYKTIIAKLVLHMLQSDSPIQENTPVSD